MIELRVVNVRETGEKILQTRRTHGLVKHHNGDLVLCKLRLDEMEWRDVPVFESDAVGWVIQHD